ncbi:MAG TPA: class I SAM-dependent methyltransferase [Iamia sp.]|nr:class I SAM-dependent methyltransferase [Iamia sp.]
MAAIAKKARNALHRAGTEIRLRRAGHGDMARAVAVAYRARPTAPLAVWSERIEAERERLHADRSDLAGEPLGVVARRDSTSMRRCQSMAALIAATGARSVVEMGTAVGISSAYLAAALETGGGGRVITLDLSPERHAVARDLHERLGLEARVEARTGHFAATLDEALADAAPIDVLFVDGHHQHEPTVQYYEQARPHLAPGAVVIFDDIRWSDGMRQAWAEVRQAPQTAAVADLGATGWVRVA